jgi:putative salt-induced outer membrane protein YdiY
MKEIGTLQESNNDMIVCRTRRGGLEFSEKSQKRQVVPKHQTLKKLRCIVMSRVRLRIRFWSSILLCLLMSPRVHAETVILVDGDIIRGQITEKTESAIILVHEVLGKLEIPKEQIASLTFVHDVLGEITISPGQMPPLAASKPEVETVVMVRGDTVHGEITEKTDSTIIMVHNVLGRLEIPQGQIASITVVHDVLGKIDASKDQIITLTTAESEKQRPEQAAAPDKQQAKQREDEEDVWFEPEFGRLNALAARLQKRKWSFAADFSINTSSGETEEETTRFGAHIERTLPRERLAVDMSYYHKTSIGQVTDNKFTLGAVHDWLNPGSRWFFFTAARYDYDEFESWEQRGNIQVGPGYNLIKSDDVLLDFRLGAGGRREWGSLNSDLKFEGVAGLDFKWRLTEKQNFETSVWLFPVLTDFDDYRTRTTLNWRYRLAKEMNLSLIVGVLHEYQSIVDPGAEESETRVFTGIRVEF